MKTLWKVSLSALSLAAFTGLPGCASTDDEDYAGSYDDGYCDAWGCPDAYWDYPVYYGPIYYNGAWLNGPIYCRDFDGRRQFWVHGGWHNDGWRGNRPAQYPAGHVGPALGRDFYRASFQGSGGTGNQNRGFRENEAGLAGQSFQSNGTRNIASGSSNNGGGRGGGGNVGGGNRGGGDGNGGGGNRSGGGGGGGNSSGGNNGGNNGNGGGRSH